jgi:hypothetical protein
VLALDFLAEALVACLNLLIMGKYFDYKGSLVADQIEEGIGMILCFIGVCAFLLVVFMVLICFL